MRERIGRCTDRELAPGRGGTAPMAAAPWPGSASRERTCDRRRSFACLGQKTSSANPSMAWVVTQLKAQKGGDGRQSTAVLPLMTTSQRARLDAPGLGVTIAANRQSGRGKPRP
jgi:hypothetical protein